jgi:hypothetical protein
MATKKAGRSLASWGVWFALVGSCRVLLAASPPGPAARARLGPRGWQRPPSAALSGAFPQALLEPFLWALFG